jgi:DNA-binding CsgD family transcriptional regulator
MLIGDEGVADAAMRRFLAAGTVHGILSPFVLIPEAYRAPLLALARRIGADTATIVLLSGIPAPFQATGMRVVLTRRETEVLDAIRRNASQAEIAASMGVAANTVKSQTRTLYRKLGASHRDDALRAAYLQGLLDGPVT